MRSTRRLRARDQGAQGPHGGPGRRDRPAQGGARRLRAAGRQGRRVEGQPHRAEGAAGLRPGAGRPAGGDHRQAARRAGGHARAARPPGGAFHGRDAPHRRRADAGARARRGVRRAATSGAPWPIASPRSAPAAGRRSGPRRARRRRASRRLPVASRLRPLNGHRWQRFGGAPRKKMRPKAPLPCPPPQKCPKPARYQRSAVGLACSIASPVWPRADRNEPGAYAGLAAATVGCAGCQAHDFARGECAGLREPAIRRLHAVV